MQNIDTYQLVKALHIISFTCWMAGLFYLPRLFVYHCGAINNEEMYKTFLTMEYKLFHYIMQPSMFATYLTGIAMSWMMNWENSYKINFHIKGICVFLLTISHFWMMKIMQDFAMKQNKKSHIFFRILNEVPTVMLITIVLMMVVWN